MYLQGLEEHTRHRNAVQRQATVPDVCGRARFLVLPSGRRLAFSEFGDLQGFPLFYMHSHAGSRLEGLFFHDSARAAGFRLIAIDRPGLGLSDFVPVRGLADHAVDVSAVADQLSIDAFGLLSWSGGATAAFAVSRAVSARVKFQVSLAPLPFRLQSSGSARWADAMNSVFWRTMVRLRCRLAARWLGPTYYLNRLRQHVGRADRQVLDDSRVGAMLGRSAAEAAVQGYRGVVQDICLGLESGPRRLASLPVPVFVWQGAADTMGSVFHSQRLAEMLPHAVCYRVPNQGHFGFLQHSFTALASARRHLSGVSYHGRFITPAGALSQDICPEDPEYRFPMVAGVRK